MQNVQPLLKGMPVLVMRRGTYPNRREILGIVENWPGYIVQTEPAFHPCRFVVTVRRSHHVR